MAKTVIPDQYNEETDEFDRYVLIQKPPSHEDAPLNKDIIRVSLFSAIVVERKTADTLRYYLFDSMDPKGKFPKKLAGAIVRFAAKEFHKYLQKKVISKHSKSNSELYSSDGSVEMMQDHVNYLREKLGKPKLIFSNVECHSKENASSSRSSSASSL